MPPCRRRRCGASSSGIFPTGTAERLKEAATLAAQNTDDTAIGQQMARALVMLRRQQVSNALSASIPR